MRTLILFALVAVAFAGWQDPESHKRRLAIIEQVNSDPSSTWVAGVNPRFDGVSFEYTKMLCGSLEAKGQTNLPIREIEVPTAPPTAFDSRTQWGAKCPSTGEIRDQSNCGSCWAFGAAEAATDRACIQSNLTFHLSAEDILSCCNTCGSGCNGGYPSSAWQWIKNTGVTTGGNYHDYSWCYAYELPNCDHHTTGNYTNCQDLPSYPTPACHKYCDTNTTYPVDYTDDKRHSKTEYGVSSAVSQIQTEIQTNGPVEASFTVYEDFESYTGGVYVHKTGQELGGHAVKIIGWGVDSGQDYWTVANSWNTDWGEKGFFRILRGVNECGIEGSIVAGMWA